MTFNRKYKLICYDANNKKVKLQGNRESEVYKLNSSYIIFNVEKCQNTSNLFKCATPEEIEDWIEDKSIFVQGLNVNANYLSREEFTKTADAFMRSIKLSGFFTDAGYRFRPNTFEIKNHWLGHYELLKNFYDIVFFNNDEVKVP